MADQIVNVAGYRFVDMPDRDDLREPMREICQNIKPERNHFTRSLKASISFLQELSKQSMISSPTLK